MYTSIKNVLKYNEIIPARILVWTPRCWQFSVMATFSFPTAHPI